MQSVLMARGLIEQQRAEWTWQARDSKGGRCQQSCSVAMGVKVTLKGLSAG